MLKLAMILGAMGAAFFAGGRTIYSALQLQVPFGTAIKMTPDPANIWSWHDTLTLPANTASKTFSVMVDFDNNGKMDTENRDLRVMITDMQVVFPTTTSSDLRYQRMRINLRNGDGSLWSLAPRYEDPRGEQRSAYEAHLSTPLVLPTSSTLEVELVAGDAGPVTVDVHLIGRLVTL